MRNAGLDEAQAGIKNPEKASKTSHMQMAPPSWPWKWRRTKEPVDESQRGEWKRWLKAQHSENKDQGIQSHHFIANRWGKSGNSSRLYFGGAPKSLQMVTAAMKFKDAYSLGEKLWPNLATNVRVVKAMVFPVVMYACESWHTQKAEHQIIDAFELWCWRRLLRVSWTARYPTTPSWRRSVLNIHWKDWYWSWNSNTLATWCEELTHLNRPWCWERLKAGAEGNNRWWNGWMASLTNGHVFE